MKKISFSMELLVALAQLEDKDLAQMQRAIIAYASEGVAPSFSNVALKAFFSLFRASIDEQRSVADRQSITNRENAKAKKSPTKKKEGKVASASMKVAAHAEASAETDAVAADGNHVCNDTDAVPTRCESLPIADVATESADSLGLEAIEAVYPKLGSYRNESLSLWEELSADERKAAVGFVATYVKQHPASADQQYLNQYLKSAPWRG